MKICLVDVSRLVIQRQRQGFLVSVTWVRVSACTPVIPAVFYLSTGLAGCSVDPGISCSARKLARTPRVKKKKSCLVDILWLCRKSDDHDDS
jgi:hypothetical protein